jgi:Ribonuclease G/E
MCSEIYRGIVAYVRRNSGVEGMCVKTYTNPEVLEKLKGKGKLLFDIEKKFGVKLSFVADTAFHIEHYKITH